MKIAFFVNTFPSISETFILSQITGLIDRGCTLQIFTQSKPDMMLVHDDINNYELFKKIIYIEVPKKTTKLIFCTITSLLYLTIKKNINLSFFKFSTRTKGKRKTLEMICILKYLVKYKNYDVLHSHFGPNGEMISCFKMHGLIDAKVITTLHGYDMSRTIKQYNESYYSCMKKCDLLLPVSEYWKKNLIKMGVCNEKIKVHRMGVKVNNIRYKLRNDKRQIIVITVGRLVEKKGIEYSIHAINEVIKNLKNKIIKYYIVGNGHLRKNLENEVHQLRLNDCVYFLGPKTNIEIKQLLEQSDIFLLSSVTAQDGDKEGIPVSIMEAMASGLPVVSTTHSGIPELVQNGKSGYLVPERSVRELTKYIEILARDVDLRNKMGLYGKDYVYKYFNIDKLNDELYNMYKSIINE
jgi:colanic acid/amylovoran biosynthesis glycosyltransferase